MTVRRRTNHFAIFALVTGLVGMVVLAVAFAAVALVQTRRRGERGIRLAIGALAASAAWILAVVALLAAPPNLRLGDDRGDGLAAIADLDAGDCFTGLTDNGTGGFRAKEMACSQPHEGEVVAHAEVPSGESTTWAEQLCGKKTEYLRRSRYYEDLKAYYDWSGGESSGEGQMLTCVMRYTGSASLTAPLAATVDTRLKTYDQLNTGECIDEWEVTDPFTAAISCEKPHRFQVYATFTLSTGDSSMEYGGYPGEDALAKKAAPGCGKRADKVFRQAPLDPDLELMYVMPSEANWYAGVHDIVCLVTTSHGKLKKSVLP